jgi:hypothetical protein
MTSILYTHRQFNRLFFLFLFFGAMAAIVAVILDHRPWVVLPILGALALAILLFSSLSVEVSNTRLRFWYGVGLLHWNIPLSDISTVARSRSHWYEGWGIRLSFRGWLYNISGFDCIEVRRSNGSAFRLGTDDPERLLSALQQALTKSGH